MYRALVCITTCARLHRLKRYLPHFVAYLREDPRFDLLVALDGHDEEYLRFCDEWDVPLVHSDEREGVGLSKNRVLERLPDYDYYFFVEDDVELVDGRVFALHVTVSAESGIHHFSLGERGSVRSVVGKSDIGGQRVVHGQYGGATFSFFTREGLDRVGGWHPAFAEYRRWGHTEHSYRFAIRGLAPAPFNMIEDLSPCCIWHSPPRVTFVPGVPTDDDQIAQPERELMERALDHVPLTTLSPHHFNGKAFGGEDRLVDRLSEGRYPLVSGRERTRCWSDYHLWRSRTATGFGERVWAFAKGAWLWPGNPMLRHQIKGVLGR